MKTKFPLPNIILSVILLVLGTGLCVGYCEAPTSASGYVQDQVQTSLPSEQVVYQFFVEPVGIEWVDTYDPDTLNAKIMECQSRQDAAHQLAENARALGHEDDSPVILLAKDEWVLASSARDFFEQRMDEVNALRAERKETTEYYYATEVWNYLHNMGLNDWVSAGIIGNMMAECGGQTLDLQVLIDNGSHWGMCQWSHYYYPQINGADFNTQCDFLRDTIEKEINTFGFLYKTGFDYSDFCSLTDAREAAKAFALTYERCGDSSYSARQRNAETAYTYFVG